MYGKKLKLISTKINTEIKKTDYGNTLVCLTHAMMKWWFGQGCLKKFFINVDSSSTTQLYSSSRLSLYSGQYLHEVVAAVLLTCIKVTTNSMGMFNPWRGGGGRAWGHTHPDVKMYAFACVTL